MNNFDHYAATRELIKDLHSKGHINEANLLLEAMENGATGTEIFMALRFHLLEILQQDRLEESSNVLAIKLIKELDRVLE